MQASIPPHAGLLKLEHVHTNGAQSHRRAFAVRSHAGSSYSTSAGASVCDLSAACQALNPALDAEAQQETHARTNRGSTPPGTIVGIFPAVSPKLAVLTGRHAPSPPHVLMTSHR